MNSDSNRGINDKVSEEEYENILEPDKGARIRCPEDWGGHGENLSEFFCTKCKKEFSMFDKKGKMRGSVIDEYP